MRWCGPLGALCEPGWWCLWSPLVLSEQSRVFQALLWGWKLGCRALGRPWSLGACRWSWWRGRLSLCVCVGGGLTREWRAPLLAVMRSPRRRCLRSLLAASGPPPLPGPAPSWQPPPAPVNTEQRDWQPLVIFILILTILTYFKGCNRVNQLNMDTCQALLNALRNSNLTSACFNSSLHTSSSESSRKFIA